MSDVNKCTATVFEVVTWALDNGWSRSSANRAWDYLSAGVHYSNQPDDAALAMMRRQHHDAHKPSLAEAIADEVLNHLVNTGHIGTVHAHNLTPEIAETVKRVLDEEGIS